MRILELYLRELEETMKDGASRDHEKSQQHKERYEGVDVDENVRDAIWGQGYFNGWASAQQLYAKKLSALADALAEERRP